MKKKKMKWIILFLIIVFISFITLFYIRKYQKKKVYNWNEFKIQVSKSTSLKEATLHWIYAYLDQYQEKNVWWSKALEKQSIVDIEIIDEEEKLVLIDTKLYPRYPNFFKSDAWGVMDGQKEYVIYRWIFRFQEEKNNDMTIYSVTEKMPPVQWDLEEGNISGRFEYEKQYYQDISELKKKEKENPYFYKIKGNNIYLTYDGHKTYVKANLEQPLELEKEYQLEDGLYQINSNVTLLSDSKQLYYSNNKEGTFKRLNLPVEETILYLHFINSDIGYIFTEAGNALGGVIGIRILKTIDGGKTFTTVKTNLETLHTSSEYNIINENVMFITDTKNGGTNGILYKSEDGGSTFEEVKLEEGTFHIEQTKPEPLFSFSEIYDTPMLPIEVDGILYLLVGQGSDGDYGNYLALYTSEDLGKNFKFKIEVQEQGEG